MPLSYFDSRQRGEVLSRVTNDVDNIQTSLSMTISQLMTSVLTVFAVLVMMLTISPLLTLLTVVTVPLSLWATRVIARRSQRMFVAQWANTGRLNAHIEETYSGFTIVKTFGHRAHAQEQFGEFNDDVYQTSFGAQFFSGLVSPATVFIGNISYVAVAVVGGHSGRDGSDHPRQHPGVHPVRPPVQPAADPGRRHVQHAAIRRGQRGAGVRAARRGGGVCRAGADALFTGRGAPAASSSETSTSAIAPAHPSSRTCRWSPNREAPWRSSGRRARARRRW